MKSVYTLHTVYYILRRECFVQTCLEPASRNRVTGQLSTRRAWTWTWAWTVVVAGSSSPKSLRTFLHTYPTYPYMYYILTYILY